MPWLLSALGLLSAAARQGLAVSGEQRIFCTCISVGIIRPYTYVSLTDTWRVAGVLMSSTHIAYANIRVHTHTYITLIDTCSRSRGLAVSSG